MKKLSLLFAAIILIGLYSCDNKKSEAAEEKVEQKQEEAKEDYSGMLELNLDDYAIPASMYIPNGNQGEPKINETAYGSVEIDVNDKFGLEIVPFGISISEKKAELENDLVYEIKIIEENENYIIYEKSIKDSDVETEYHFFMSVEVGGDLYELKSMPSKSFSKTAVEKMMKSAKSFNPKMSA